MILGEDEIKSASPRSTQTVEIEAFVKAGEIAFMLLDTRLYLENMAKRKPGSGAGRNERRGVVSPGKLAANAPPRKRA